MQILAGIILLGVLVTFHELGHFLFAKWLGVRVLVFSVGFGPKLIGFKRGDTEYRLSAIPLGGYVRMFGESLEEELSPEEKKMSFMHQAIWRKSLIAVAGPVFNFILPIILFFCLLVGTEQIFAPRVGTLLKDGVAEKAGLKLSDLIIAANSTKVESFNEVAEIIAHHPNQEVMLTVERKGEDGALLKLSIPVIPEAKSSQNPLEKDQLVGRIGIMPAIELPIVTVAENSPLNNLLENFDQIQMIDGQEITGKETLYRALAKLKPSSKISVLRNEERKDLIVPGNLSLALEAPPLQIKDLSETYKKSEALEKTKILLLSDQAEWKKNHGVMSANGAITEVASGSLAYELGIAPKDHVVSIDGEKIVNGTQLQQAIMQNAHESHLLGVLKNDGSPWIIEFSLPKTKVDHLSLDSDLLNLFGITTAQVFKAGEMISRYVSPLEAFKRAVLQTWDIVVMTGKSLWLLVKREVPASQVGGPIMLFDVAQQAAQKGLAYYIFIMCLLSVNLGLLNLLPIPALDGGHLLLFGIEAIQRKPLTVRTRAIATQIGIVILLSIMAFALFNDLSRLFR